MGRRSRGASRPAACSESGGVCTRSGTPRSRARAEFLKEVLIAGEGAALSHEACAELYEVRRWRASLIDVVVPSERRLTSQRADTPRRTLHPDDVTVHKGIPCTTIARLVVDLTDHLTSWEITNVIHEAEWLDLFNLDATYCGHRTRQGRRIAAARKAVATAPRRLRRRPEQERAQSPHRSRAQATPRAKVNTELNGYEVDYHWPALKLCHRARRTRPRPRTDAARGRDQRTRLASRRL